MEKRRAGRVLGAQAVEYGAPIHNNSRADRARKRLFTSSHDHPPNSPDLNEIEPLWNVLKTRLGKFRSVPSTEDELWEVLYRLWDEIEQDLVDKEVERMKNRIATVILRQGKHTDF